MTPLAGTTTSRGALPRAADVAASGLSLRKLDGPLGAELRGVDLRHVDDETFDAIYQAWLDNLVLLVRGQHLSDTDLIAFSRHFGALDHAPIQENGRRFVEGYPEIYVVSNVVEYGVAIGSLGAGEAVWHTDMSYLPDPPKASMLYALEVPPSGGDTSFSNMYAAHPETGRRMLYLGRRRNAYLMGLDLEESERLLDALWAHAERPALCWTHRWRVGDLVIWDNRCTMHRRDPFDPGSRRVMHRTQIKGEAPSAA